MFGLCKLSIVRRWKGPWDLSGLLQCSQSHISVPSRSPALTNNYRCSLWKSDLHTMSYLDAAYLLSCALCSVSCLSAFCWTLCALSKTHIHTDTAVWWRRPGLWAVDQDIYLPVSSMSVCNIIGEQQCELWCCMKRFIKFRPNFSSGTLICQKWQLLTPIWKESLWAGTIEEWNENYRWTECEDIFLMRSYWRADVLQFNANTLFSLPVARWADQCSGDQ